MTSAIERRRDVRAPGSVDAYHLTSVDPARTQVDQCVLNANTSTDDITYLNAHGPGTQQCDTAEDPPPSSPAP